GPVPRRPRGSRCRGRPRTATVPCAGPAPGPGRPPIRSSGPVRRACRGNRLTRASPALPALSGPGRGPLSVTERTTGSEAGPAIGGTGWRPGVRGGELWYGSAVTTVTETVLPLGAVYSRVSSTLAPRMAWPSGESGE